MEPTLVTFDASFHETQLEHAGDNPDVFASVTIDGFPADEDASGRVVAVVYVTKHGDVVTAWHENGCRMNRSALELVEQARNDLREEFARDGQAKPVVTDGSGSVHD